MKTDVSKSEAQKQISSFFEKDFSIEELKKIKRLAMKYKLKLGDYRKFYCPSCLSQLKGNISISKTPKGIYKTIVCANCKTKNKFKI